MLLLTATLVGGPGPAHAAVRVCADRISGDFVEDVTEVAAKNAALASWQARVAKLSDDAKMGTWRLAANRNFACSKLPNGRFRCQAIGHPCVLKQVPPEGKLKRLLPVQ